jgi:hypothetical protein
MNSENSREGMTVVEAPVSETSMMLGVMLQEYKTLRDEILRSVELQSKTFAYEGVFLGLALSISFIEDRLRLLLIGIPPTFIAFSFMWLIEQSRMMRAGNYLEWLEIRINRTLGGKVSLSWENWLRRPGVPLLSSHRIHHYSQYGLVLFLFLSVTVVAIAGMVFFQVLVEPFLTFLVVLYGALLVLVITLTLPIVIHRSESRKQKRMELALTWVEWEQDFARLCASTDVPSG